MDICNCPTQELEAGRSVVQDHLQSHSDYEVSLSYWRVCLKKTKGRGTKEMISQLKIHTAFTEDLSSIFSACAGWLTTPALQLQGFQYFWPSWVLSYMRVPSHRHTDTHKLK